MAHSLTRAVAPPTTPISSTRTRTKAIPPPLGFPRNSEPCLHNCSVTRRDVGLGLFGAVLGGLSDRNANAAARRPPPPPPTEKKDPNVSGVVAKVLASKKRKEAMKDSVAKLREKGNPIIN